MSHYEITTTHEVDEEASLRYSIADAGQQLIRLVESSERATPPWIKPWEDGPDLGAQRSIRGNVYTGYNQFITTAMAYRYRYNDNRWLTHAEVTKRAGQLRAGAEPTLILGIFNVNESSQNLRYRVIPIFNADQTIGCVTPPLKFGNEPVADPIAAAENIIRQYADTPPMRNDGSEALYYPVRDCIEMPPPSRFISSEDYYATIFHEMVHSTGHDSRLDRFGEGGSILIHERASEELVAEMGAALLCTEAGISRTEIEEQHRAYIGHWRQYILNSAGTAVVSAAERAQRAVQYILGLDEDDGEANN